jgi:hypothetical protein
VDAVVTDPIQRYVIFRDEYLHPIEVADPGDIACIVVLAADAEAHEAAAVAAARSWATPETVEQANYWYEQGQRDERARIRAGVRAIETVEWALNPEAAVLAVIDAAPRCTCDLHDCAIHDAAPQDEPAWVKAGKRVCGCGHTWGDHDGDDVCSLCDCVNITPPVAPQDEKVCLDCGATDHRTYDCPQDGE